MRWTTKNLVNRVRDLGLLSSPLDPALSERVLQKLKVCYVGSVEPDTARSRCPHYPDAMPATPTCDPNVPLSCFSITLDMGTKSSCPDKASRNFGRTSRNPVLNYIGVPDRFMTTPAHTRRSPNTICFHGSCIREEHSAARCPAGRGTGRPGFRPVRPEPLGRSL